MRLIDFPRLVLLGMAVIVLALWGTPETAYPHGQRTCLNARATANCQVNGIIDKCIGTKGNDVIVGTVYADVIFGRGGNDTIIGKGGGDLLCGGPGDDYLDGSDGKDRLWGGLGDDILRGGPSDDTLFGSFGDDLLEGGAGADRLIGSRGSDTLIPGPGPDVAAARGSDDTVIIFDLCEVAAGERLVGGRGDDVLVVPADLSELKAIGAIITGFERIQIDNSTPCSSTCKCDIDLSEPPNWKFAGPATVFAPNEWPDVVQAFENEDDTADDGEEDADGPLSDPDESGISVLVAARVEQEELPHEIVLDLDSVPFLGEPATDIGDEFDEVPPPPAGILSPRTVFGTDDRTRRFETSEYPWRTFGWLVHLDLGDNVTPQQACQSPDRVKEVCSAVLIGPRMALTAGHCLSDGDRGWAPTLYFVPGQTGNDAERNNDPFNSVSPVCPFRPWRAVRYITPRAWHRRGNYRYDYGVVILADDNRTLGWLGWRRFSLRQLKNQTHWNFGYPFDRARCDLNNCLTTPINGVGCVGCGSLSLRCSPWLWGMSCKINNVFAQRLNAKCDAHRGQSGSPLYKYNGGDRRIVGVTSSGQSNTNKYVRITRFRSGKLCDYSREFPSSFRDGPCD